MRIMLLLLLLSSATAFAQSETTAATDNPFRRHSISLGLQGPTQSFLSASTGERMALPSFPLTLRYSYHANEHHVFGYTSGLKIYAQTPTVAFVPNEGTFWVENQIPIISSRVDYRWFPRDREHRLQPYIGAGMLVQTSVILLRNQTIVTNSFGIQGLGGMRWNMNNRLFLEAEVPLTLPFPSVGNLGPQVGHAILETLGVHQPGRLWPLIGIGYRF